jgi:hypothetical protein
MLEADGNEPLALLGTSCDRSLVGHKLALALAELDQRRVPYGRP